MSEDWAGVAAEVAAALGEVSASTAKLIVPATVGGISPSKPGAVTETEHEMAATESKFTWREVQDSALKAGDLMLVTEARAGVPEPQPLKHAVEWAGVRYQIIQARPLRPDGVTAVSYRLHLRK